MFAISRKTRLFFIKFLMILTLINIQFSAPPAHAASDVGEVIVGVVEWIFEAIFEIFNALTSSCVALPKFHSFTTGSTQIDLDPLSKETGRWIAAANGVQKDKMVKVQWNTRGIKSKPRKYFVVYRIDPRFSKPQIFILKKNYITGKYESDFHDFNGGKLLSYQKDPNLNFAGRGADYDDYFSFRGDRKPIKVDYGDVVSISLTKMTSILKEYPNFQKSLSPKVRYFNSIFINTRSQENTILYSDANSWCKYLNKHPRLSADITCTTDPASGREVWAGQMGSYRNLFGNLDMPARLSAPPCPMDRVGSKHNKLCLYDQGRGMNIFVGGTEVKQTYEPFFRSQLDKKDFFYYKAKERGTLDFSSNISMKDPYVDFTRSMKDWSSNPKYSASYDSMKAYLDSIEGYTDTMMDSVHLGRYVMMVNIGNSEYAANFHQKNDIKVSYLIGPSAPAPSPSERGMLMGTQEERLDANQDGTLWIKVDNPHGEVTGKIRISYAHYTGSKFLSNLLYNSIALPVMDLMRNVAKLFYQGIATNPTWQATVKTLLSLYISFYAIYFLIGKVQVTAYDLVVRVCKLAVVFAMFDARSWEFFNKNVFTIFLDGMSYLAYSVAGITSSVDNIFGFVDIIFDKYTNPVVWQVLGVQLLQLHNGMTFVTILMIEAVLSYLMAVIDVVISYIMAFLTLTILISLAPLFIVAMLFERTRSMFDNWTSLLLSYMIQPTVLLIFFLLMDQMMSNQFSQTAMNVCWDWLIKMNFDLDLSLIGLDFRLRFDLPFLPGIPFYTTALVMMQLACPFVTLGGELTRVAGAVLMFKIYAQISTGLIEYVTNIVSEITNVAPARKHGNRQSASNVVSGVTDDIKAPMRKAGSASWGRAKQVGSAMRSGWKNPKLKAGDTSKMKDHTEDNKPSIKKRDGSDSDA